MQKLQEEKYSDVALEHMLVDNANFQIINWPRQFDVIVTENEFGDILSDGAVNIPGSLGVVPSASVSEEGKGLFEPIHGSAPHIAGENRANPTAMILSAAWALEQSLDMPDEAFAIQKAVDETYEQGIFTADLWHPHRAVTTKGFTDAVLRNLRGCR